MKIKHIEILNTFQICNRFHKRKFYITNIKPEVDIPELSHMSNMSQ